MNQLEYLLNNGTRGQIEYSRRNIALIGENGAGKSSFLRALSCVRDQTAVIIAAQKNLTMTQGKLRGHDDQALIQESRTFAGSRWSGGMSLTPANNNLIQSDIDGVIETLVRHHINTTVGLIDRRKKQGKQTVKLDFRTDLDSAFEAWGRVFVGKELNLVEGKIKVSNSSNPDADEYDISELSDGEKASFYIFAKVTLAKEEETIVIDEPETFLNPALLGEIFDLCESLRPKNKFVYFSHDIEFVVTRQNCSLVWIKSFAYPDQWEFEDVDSTDGLPEELIIRIVGAKKRKILFVEGINGGDASLYSRVYPEFKVIPVGSCENVIQYTKSLRSNTGRHYSKEYFGLIDRDLKGSEQLQTLENARIFHIPYAIYENLFMNKSLVEFMYQYLGKQGEFDTNFQKLEACIKENAKATSYQNTYVENLTQQYFNQNIRSVAKDVSKFQPDIATYSQQAQELASKDARTILERYNQKDLLRSCVNLNTLGYQWQKWIDQVLSIFNTDKKDDLRSLFLEFMPEIK